MDESGIITRRGSTIYQKVAVVHGTVCTIPPRNSSTNQYSLLVPMIGHIAHYRAQLISYSEPSWEPCNNSMIYKTCTTTQSKKTKTLMRKRRKINYQKRKETFMLKRSLEPWIPMLVTLRNARRST